ncbi:unnamed protein product [Eretmochelys imbricata]
MAASARGRLTAACRRHPRRDPRLPPRPAHWERWDLYGSGRKVARPDLERGACRDTLLCPRVLRGCAAPIFVFLPRWWRWVRGERGAKRALPTFPTDRRPRLHPPPSGPRRGRSPVPSPQTGPAQAAAPPPPPREQRGPRMSPGGGGSSSSSESVRAAPGSRPQRAGPETVEIHFIICKDKLLKLWKNMSC